MSGFARGRAALLVLGFASLVLGISGGLARLGIRVPFDAAVLVAGHGALMVGGFFGTLISLERAVALGRREAYVVPLCAGAGGVSLLFVPMAGAWLICAASAGLLVVSLVIAWRQRAAFTALLALGSACWLIGCIAWIGGWSIREAVPWWLGFFLLTIAGERLELTRMLPRRRGASRSFLVVVLLILVGMPAASVAPAWGWTVFAGASAALALWLLSYDIARRTVRAGGLTRCIAVNLLAGYAWLLVGAGCALALGAGHRAAGLYDASVHALALGFVFSMVFGHAPVIFPAVLRVRMPYTPWFYAAPVVLHVSLAVRLAGDLAGSSPARVYGAWGNVAAILLFIVVSAGAALRGQNSTK